MVKHPGCEAISTLILFLSDKEVFGSGSLKSRRSSGLANHGYCSELILWKVETVGPLGESGGVTELARINSPQMSAFASVAWIPTVLPRYIVQYSQLIHVVLMYHILNSSSSLGGFSNSASACFVASDGFSLRIYQVNFHTLSSRFLKLHGCKFV